MISFKEYFSNLQIPLKDTSNMFIIIFESIAASFDLLKKYGVSTVEKFFVDSNLEEYAKERCIYKIQEESNNSYKNRVLNAYQFLKYSSTSIGIKDVISNAISKSFEIRELYQENFILGNSSEKLGINTKLHTSLSSYFFLVEFIQPLTVKEKYYLEKIIDLYKPAHVGFRINATIVDDWILGDENEQLGLNTYL